MNVACRRRECPTLRNRNLSRLILASSSKATLDEGNRVPNKDIRIRSTEPIKQCASQLELCETNNFVST